MRAGLLYIELKYVWKIRRSKNWYYSIGLLNKNF